MKITRNPLGPVVMVMVAAAAPLTLSAATPEEVEKTIETLKQALYSQISDGNWEGPKVQGKGANVGGKTALTVYALLSAGESPQNPRLAPAIAYLKSLEIQGVYTAGLRTQVWRYLPQKEDVRKLMLKDCESLLATLKTDGAAQGMFHYRLAPNADPGFDRSNSQYGVLGLWACAMLDAEIPRKAWEIMDTQWRAHQLAGGAWSYAGSGTTPRGSMTIAGLCSLFITRDMLYGMDGLECTGNVVDENIERGIKWLTQNYDSIHTGHIYYNYYGLERLGVASGLKYIGPVNWYEEGADYIVSKPPRDRVNASFALLFLVYGRAPVAMNKLQYGIDARGDQVRPANWNQRPRDAANFTGWLSKQTERLLNWQIVNMDVPVEQLADAPILYISGNQALTFTAEEQQKLRQVIEQGGLILGNPDCNSSSFEKSFRNLGTKLFPMYEFRELPRDHVIYTSQQFPRRASGTAPSVLGLSNGARELMILVRGDPSRYWQSRVTGSREPFWEIPANIFQYMVDRSNLRYKGDSHIIVRGQGAATSRIKVARLQYAGCWDPEPGGWRRLDALMHNTQKTDLEVVPVKLGAGKLDGSFKVAHLTGTVRFAWTDAERNEIRRYVEGGGTLVIDSCGGVAAFSDAVEKELARAFPEAPLAALPPEHAIYSGPSKCQEVAWRRFARRLINTRQPRLKAIQIAGRPAVIYSAEDLSVGLVGHLVDGIHGYAPASAAALMSNILHFAADTKATGDVADWKPSAVRMGAAARAKPGEEGPSDQGADEAGNIGKPATKPAKERKRQ